MKPNRRDLLKAAAVVAGACRLTAASAPAFRFPSAPRDRLAVASYPFRAYIDSPRRGGAKPAGPLMDLKDFPAMVVKHFNIRNVELLGEHFRSTEPDYLAGLRDALRAAHARVVDIPTGIGGSVYDPDPARRATAVTNAQRWIDAAEYLQSPSVRVHIERPRAAPASGAGDLSAGSSNGGTLIAGVSGATVAGPGGPASQGGVTAPPAGGPIDNVGTLGPGAEADPRLAAQTLAQIAAYGASKNVVVTLENDDPVTEDAFFIAKVIDLANTPWLRALPDFCNSMLKGDEDFNYRAVAEMFKRAYSIAHTKDVEVDHGKIFRVDLKRTYGIAQAAGYKGYFSMEFEGQSDPYEGTQKLLDASLQYLA